MEQQVDPLIERQACELARSKTFTELLFHLVNFALGGRHGEHSVLLALQKRYQQDLEEAVKNERKQCALIAKTEPLPKGDPPPAVALTMLSMSVTKNVMAAIAATKDNIAKKIEQRGQ